MAVQGTPATSGAVPQRADPLPGLPPLRGRFAPHGKTALSPGLYAHQEALGAWAVTVATPHQARVFRAGGARRIHYANPLVHTGFARWVQREMAADPQFGFTAYVDSIEGVRLLGAALDPHGPPLPVLVELGHAGGRTGCRTPEQVLAVAQAAAAETALGSSASPRTRAASVTPAPPKLSPRSPGSCTPSVTPCPVSPARACWTPVPVRAIGW
ncbi:putative amino acid aldolase or racemase [Streptomyces himastatinicus ATCC 53653]|uniref:Putative amino acid aldolase or racemase n=1 Tax=Streptomyces himastatinicus ATCC 53653 TaxID=457427 RepID=D9WL62_9ACTN|nr:putative amino acid aldolase or racemase [Streptomyces himastatinicus ATCC 53653]